MFIKERKFFIIKKIIPLICLVYIYVIKAGVCLCKIIKGTSGFNLNKTNFLARWRQLVLAPTT